jgi:molybdopterin converting factor small subunit
MLIHVRLGEPYWREVGQHRVDVDLGPEATVQELLAAIEQRFPTLLQADIPPTVLLGEAVVEASAHLTDGAAVTLLWAVAGG